jgi:hypothetical protein
MESDLERLLNKDVSNAAQSDVGFCSSAASSFLDGLAAIAVEKTAKTAAPSNIFSFIVLRSSGLIQSHFNPLYDPASADIQKKDEFL